MTTSTDISQQRPYERRMNQLSDTAQLAIYLCSTAIKFGGTWGFIRRDDELYRDKLAVMREERGNAMGLQLANGVLIIVKPDFLIANVNKLLPNTIDESFIRDITSRKEKELLRFKNFAKGVREGKEQHVTQHRDYKEITIGIYSYNSSRLMRVNGIDYPAFNLTLQEVLNVALELDNNRDNVYVKAEKPDGLKVFGQVFDLASNSKGLKGIFKAMSIAQSNHGVFLTLRIRQSR